MIRTIGRGGPESDQSARPAGKIPTLSGNWVARFWGAVLSSTTYPHQHTAHSAPGIELAPLQQEGSWPAGTNTMGRGAAFASDCKTEFLRPQVKYLMVSLSPKSYGFKAQAVIQTQHWRAQIQKGLKGPGRVMLAMVAVSLWWTQINPMGDGHGCK